MYAGRHGGHPLQEDIGFRADSKMLPRATTNPVGDGHCAVLLTRALRQCTNRRARPNQPVIAKPVRKLAVAIRIPLRHA